MKVLNAFGLLEKNSIHFCAALQLLGAAAANAFVSDPGGTNGSWTRLNAAAPGSVNLMLLLPDGTVMAHDASSWRAWYRLAPSSNGSYVQGAWSNMPPMHDSRLYFSSAVLRDGRVFVAGGEYGNGTFSSELYDPAQNTWTYIPLPDGLLDRSSTGRGLADSSCCLLPDGKVLVSPAPSVHSHGRTLVFDPQGSIWSRGPDYTFEGRYQQEESWVKLADDSILTVNTGALTSQRFIPALGQWVSDSNLPVPLYDGLDDEVGAALLLADGRAFCLGGTGHTALYSPSGSAEPGAWSAGPDIPDGLVTVDAPAAVMPNGRVLCLVGPAPRRQFEFRSPTYFFEYDPASNSFSQINGPTGQTDAIAPFQTQLLALPDGTILYSSTGTRLYVYQPGGESLSELGPIITAIQPGSDGSYRLTGKRLNGFSAGAAYGDDAQMDSNYPLVRLEDTGGKVTYATTYNWSSTGVQTGDKLVSTDFRLPSSLPPGDYSLVVVVNGIASHPYAFSVSAAPASSAPPAPALANGKFNFTAITPVGKTYVVQTSTDLVRWISVSTNTGPANGSALISDDVLATQPRLFYRVVPLAP